MRISRKTASVAITAVLLALPAWAADEAKTSSVATALANLLPLILIFGLVYFALRRVNRRNGPYMDRAMTHMQRLEQQNEEIIRLLKNIAGTRNSEPPPPPPSGSAPRPPQG